MRTTWRFVIISTPSLRLEFPRSEFWDITARYHRVCLLLPASCRR